MSCIFSEGYYYYHLYNHVYLIGLAPLRHGEEMERLDLGRYSTQLIHDGDFLASSKSNEFVMWMFYDIYLYPDAPCMVYYLHLGDF